MSLAIVRMRTSGHGAGNRGAAPPTAVRGRARFRRRAAPAASRHDRICASSACSMTEAGLRALRSSFGNSVSHLTSARIADEFLRKAEKRQETYGCSERPHLPMKRPART